MVLPGSFYLTFQVSYVDVEYGKSIMSMIPRRGTSSPLQRKSPEAPSISASILLHKLLAIYLLADY